jgi:hypothetical protein
MLASICSKHDLELYLAEGEQEQLRTEPLIGTLVQLAHPKRQKPITLCLDEQLSTGMCGGEFAYGVGVDLTGETVGIYLSEEYYRKLLENGTFGTRYGSMGRKVSITRAPFKDSMDKFAVDDLKWYIAKRDELPSHYD